MALLEINRHPTARELRRFGVLLAAFVALAGGLLYWRFEAPAAARMVWTAVCGTGRDLRGGGGTATVDLPWLVVRSVPGRVDLVARDAGRSVLSGAGAYRPVVPLFRGDPLDRTPNRSAASYWVVRRPVRNVRRYFRQF